MAAHGILVELIAQAKRGDCLRAALPWDGPVGNAGGSIMLLGHRDTVFGDGEAARRPFTVRHGVADGPGVADMKAGLVMNCFMLAAFHRCGGAPAPMVALFTGDEEIGSPEGRAVIEAEARGARAVFNSEPGRPSGAVVTGRKGACSALCVTGKAAHSGGAFTEGISARICSPFPRAAGSACSHRQERHSGRKPTGYRPYPRGDGRDPLGRGSFRAAHPGQDYPAG